MSSPASRMGLGECNAITSRRFGDGKSEPHMFVALIMVRRASVRVVRSVSIVRH